MTNETFWCTLSLKNFQGLLKYTKKFSRSLLKVCQKDKGSNELRYNKLATHWGDIQACEKNKTKQTNQITWTIICAITVLTKLDFKRKKALSAIQLLWHPKFQSHKNQLIRIIQQESQLTRFLSYSANLLYQNKTTFHFILFELVWC